MRLLVLGAGAIGGYFGGRLAETGGDVTFLVRPRRRAQLESDGLRLRSPLGDVDLPVKTVLAEELRPEYDVVLLTCKAYDLESAMDAIAPAMTRAVVIPMLNGMTHIERLTQRFGASQVMGGTCAINAGLEADGVIRQTGKMQRLVFGKLDGSASKRATGLADALKKTNIDWKLSDDIRQDMWEKIVFLSVLAAACSLFRASAREIVAAPGGRDVLERGLATNIAIATREGFPPRPAAIEFGRAMFDPAGTWSASMLRDIEAGAPVESDHIVGWMLDRARAHGLDDTLLSLAYTHLEAYEARRAAGRLPGRQA